MDRECPHGHQLGKCDTCDLIVAEAEIACLFAQLAAANEELAELRPIAEFANRALSEIAESSDPCVAVHRANTRSLAAESALESRGSDLINAGLRLSQFENCLQAYLDEHNEASGGKCGCYLCVAASDCILALAAPAPSASPKVKCTCDETYYCGCDDREMAAKRGQPSAPDGKGGGK